MFMYIPPHIPSLQLGLQDRLSPVHDHRQAPDTSLQMLAGL